MSALFLRSFKLWHKLRWCSFCAIRWISGNNVSACYFLLFFSIVYFSYHIHAIAQKIIYEKVKREVCYPIIDLFLIQYVTGQIMQTKNYLHFVQHASNLHIWIVTPYPGSPLGSWRSCLVPDLSRVIRFLPRDLVFAVWSGCCRETIP